MQANIKMKIAVAANGKDSGADVSSHAARAPFFLVYDENGKFLDCIDNPYSSVERGAAPRVAPLLKMHGIGILVAADFGGRFVAELEENNIATIKSNGPASEAIQKLLA